VSRGFMTDVEPGESRAARPFRTDGGPTPGKLGYAEGMV
jgi:hypothetical protein